MMCVSDEVTLITLKLLNKKAYLNLLNVQVYTESCGESISML